MESEKVKEIKKALECCRNSGQGGCKDCPYYNTRDCVEMLNWDMENYINELESENERLSNTEIGELIKENEELAKQCVEWSELDFKRRNKIKELKDRIAELEKENETKTDTITDLLKKQEFYEKEKLKQFAERLKEKIKNFCGTEYENAYYDVTKSFACNDIDDTLKELQGG